MNSPERRRFLITTGLLLSGVLVLSGCRAEQRGLGREALLAEIQKLAAPAGERLEREALVDSWWHAPDGPLPTPTEDAVDPARMALARGDVEGMRKAHENWSKGTRASPEAAAHLCVAARVLEDADAVLRACPLAFRLAAEPVARLGALAALKWANVERPAALEHLRELLSPSRRGCSTGTECIALVLAEVDLLQDLASRDSTNAATPTAVVEGPFRGDAVTALWRWPAVKPRKERHRRWVPQAVSGRVYPARRNEAGAYRLRYRVRGEGEATLVVDAPPMMRVFVDGAEVLWHDGRSIERRATTLTLTGTLHDVEVVVATNASGPGVRVSFFDAGGQTWAFDNANADWPPPMKSPVGQKPLTSLVAGELSRSPTLANLERLIALADAVEQGLLPSVPSTVVIDRLLELYPHAPGAQLMLARLLERHSTATTSTTKSKVASLYGRLRKTWPQHPAVQLAQLADLDVISPQQAFAKARQAATAAPRSVRAHAVLVGQALAVDARSVALEAAREGMKLGATTEMMDAALSVFEAASLFEEAAATRVLYLRQTQASSFDARLRILLRMQKREEALAALEHQSKLSPGHPAEELRLDLLELGAPTKALRVTESLVERFPNDRTLLLRLIALQRAVGHHDAADALTRGCVRKFGAHRECIWRRREAMGDRGHREWTARGDQIFKAFVDAERDPFATEATGYLLDHTRVLYFRDGGRLTTRHEMVELKTKEAIDLWGEMALTYAEHLARFVVRKRDGRLQLPERHDALGVASLTGLEVGDVVDVIRERFDEASATDTFDEIGQVFHSAVPALERRFEIFVPRLVDEKDAVFELERKEGNGAPTVTKVVVQEPLTEEAYDRFRYVVDNAPSVPAEPHAPADVVDRPFVLATRDLDLSAIAAARYRQRLDVPRDRKTVSDRFSAAAKRISGEGTIEERFRRLFSFVAREIEPGAEDDVERSLMVGQGQRTTVLFTLAHAAGLPVQLVGAHLRTQTDDAFPTSSRFGLMAVLVRSERDLVAVVEEGVAVLNALPRTEEASMLPLSYAADARAQPLPESAMQAPPLLVDVSVQLDAERAQLSGVMTIQVPPHRAHALRNAFRRADETQRRAAFEATLASSFPGVVVTQTRLPNLDDDGQPLGVALTIQIPLPEAKGAEVEWANVFGAGAGATLGIEAGLESYLQTSRRQSTLVLAPQRERFRLQIDLGEKAVFTDVPAAFSMTVGEVTVEQTVDVQSGQLRLERDLAIDAAWLSPQRYAQRRPEWVALLRRLQLEVRFAPQPSVAVTGRGRSTKVVSASGKQSATMATGE